MVITTIPKIASGGCRPYVEIFDGKNYEIIFSNKNCNKLKKFKAWDEGDDKLQNIKITLESNPLVCGDIYIRIMHKGSILFKDSLICRFAINTAFLVDK